LDTDSGRALLGSLAGFDEEHAAAAAKRARSLATPDVAAAALATAFARRRAHASKKFERPDVMCFTRAGYEQASSSAVAAHRSGRFAGLDRVYDLCCGIGSDAIALAKSARSVIAVDLDPDALACAANNARAFGVAERIRFERADAEVVPLLDARAVFADPSRRQGHVRTRDGDAYQPALRVLLERARDIADARLCVKVAPGLDVDAPELRQALQDASLEVEFVSERGVCKEAVLWCGAFARGDGMRRATVIDPDGIHVLDGDPEIGPSVGPLSAFVGEPDSAVIRAGLIGPACESDGACALDPRVAYVTAADPKAGPFVRWYRVRDSMPFGVKRLRSYLRERSVGEVVVKTRAFPIRPDELRTLLHPRGEKRAVLFCTTIGEKKTVIVCDPA
jgi:SAM-dependent methyltransferase